MPRPAATRRSRGDVLGVLSLIVWALTIIVTIKYVVFVLRADNRGRGRHAVADGARPQRSYPTRRPALILAIGICGAALFFGDAIITPAISVLSAVEGLKVVTPAFDPYVVPITLVILAVLFAVQRFGTGSVASGVRPGHGALVPGDRRCRRCRISPTTRRCCCALNPYYAIAYLLRPVRTSPSSPSARSSWRSPARKRSMSISAISAAGRSCSPGWRSCFRACCSTISGRAPSCWRMAARRTTRSSRCCRGWALLPMVGLATAATVIASQAVISGAYSLTRQAVQLSLLPRFEIQHTSETQSGQIYLPRVNLLLALGVMLLVVGFGESSALASAYGISVTGEMLVTTILLFVVMRQRWKWRAGAGAGAGRCSSASSTSASSSANAVKVARRRLGLDRRRRR